MALNKNTIKVVIFDLDDTLFDTNGQLVQTAAREACEAMISGGLKCSLEECLSQRQAFLDQRTRGDIYKKLVNHFGVADGKKENSIAELGFNQFHNREIKERIALFPDALNVLKTLKNKFEIYLVTLGGLNTQKKKVELLGLEGLFKRIIFVDIEKEKTKSNALKTIAKAHQELKPDAFVSIGNRIDSEIRDAKELGMQTVVLNHGEYKNLIPQNNFEKADETINDLKEVLGLL